MKTELIRYANCLFLFSDEEIKEGDTIHDDLSGIFSPYEKGDCVFNPRKIIGYYPLDATFEELTEIPLLPEFEKEEDTEKMAENWLKSINLHLSSQAPGLIVGFMEGYRQAKVKHSVNYQHFPINFIPEIEEQIAENGIETLMKDSFYQKFPEELPNCVFIRTFRTTKNSEGKDVLVGTYIY